MTDSKQIVADALRETAQFLTRTEDEVAKDRLAKELLSAFQYGGATADELIVLAKKTLDFDRRGKYHHLHEHILEVIRGKRIIVFTESHELLTQRSNTLYSLESERRFCVQTSREMTVEDLFSAEEMGHVSAVALARTRDLLHKAGIKTVKELVAQSERSLLRIPMFGQKSLDLVEEALRYRGLHLDMKLEE